MTAPSKRSMRAHLRSLAWVALTLPGLAHAAAADDIALPSGAKVAFLDAIWEEPGPAGVTARFRFIDPSLGARLTGSTAFQTLQPDTAFLCENIALEQIAGHDPAPAQIIISISDRAIVFGDPDPSVKQVFEAYSIQGSDCIWEAF